MISAVATLIGSVPSETRFFSGAHRAPILYGSRSTERCHLYGPDDTVFTVTRFRSSSGASIAESNWHLTKIARHAVSLPHDLYLGLTGASDCAELLVAAEQDHSAFAFALEQATLSAEADTIEVSSSDPFPCLFTIKSLGNLYVRPTGPGSFAVSYNGKKMSESSFFSPEDLSAYDCEALSRLIPIRAILHSGEDIIVLASPSNDNELVVQSSSDRRAYRFILRFDSGLWVVDQVGCYVKTDLHSFVLVPDSAITPSRAPVERLVAAMNGSSNRPDESFTRYINLVDYKLICLGDTV